MQSDAQRNSFDRLVLENLPAAHRFAIRLTGDLDSAEELMQEALLRASRGWRSFRGESQFRTWLFAIVVNAFRDSRAARAAPQPLPNALTDDRAVDPLANAADAELGRLVGQAVSSLPLRQREVLVLHTYEQLSAAEVAKVLNISEQNVRAQLSYARTRLKQLLAPYRDTET